jgi:nitrogen fixation NifU-like protein
MSDIEYSEQVWEHFTHPRNVGSFDPVDRNVGTGFVGTLAQGDLIKLQIKVDARGVIEDARFRAHGSGAAIAAGSLASEWLQGKTLAQAAAVQDVQIAEALRLPPLKINCAVLAVRVILAAIDDYSAKQ